MTLSLADRVFETSISTGLGTINLAGAVAGFRSFVNGVGSGKKVTYIIDDGINWEIGIGTCTAGSPDTLSRTTVLASSNAGGLINWGAGTRNVRLGFAAKTSVVKDENLNLIVGHGGLAGGSANAQTITLDPAPIALSDGMIISWLSQGDVTGTLTINCNAIGAKTVKWRGADLTSGAFSTGNLIFGIYKASTGFVELITVPNNALGIADGSLSFAKTASAALASVADMVAGTLSKFVTASNFKTYIDTYIFGAAQTWQDVTSSRAISFGTTINTYTNTSSKPIMVSFVSGTTPNGDFSLFINGVAVVANGASSTANYVGLVGIIPAGASYYIFRNAGGALLAKWLELK